MNKIIFVDRDGTILLEPLDKQIDSLEKIAFVDGAIPALRTLRSAGWQLVLVSNQDGLGSSTFPTEDFAKPQEFMLAVLKSCGIEFLEVLICPHFEDDRCLCRKPKTGLVREILAAGFDRNRSAVVGDRPTDLEFAEAIGIKGFQITEEFGWREIVGDLVQTCRQASLDRKSRETEIKVSVNLDSFRPPRIETGMKFFDHMLEQIAYHAGISIQLEAKGDWAVDDHHTVEDTGLALGEVLRLALGDKFGIGRYGFVLPMDESLAELSLDLSGRSFCKFDVVFTRESISGLSTEMVPHFFLSLAEGLKASLHIRIRGDNNHHLVESGFKAFGRCLAQAIHIHAGIIPSSKGFL